MKSCMSEPSTETGNIHKKPRATRACDICRRKKVKCDSLKPSCTNCAMFGYECSYSYTPKKRGLQASNPKTLEIRLKRIEKALATFLDNEGLSTSGSASAESQFTGKPKNIPSKSSETPIKEGSDSEESEGLHEEFTKLTINQSRYKYLGSSSGIYLLEGGDHHINSILKKLVEQFKTLQVPRFPEPNFPSKETQEKLLDVYFTRSHPYFPIFNKSGFLQRLNTGKRVSKVLLNSIFAVSCILEGSTVFNDPQISRTATIFFFKQAKTELDRQYHFSSLYTVQGLLLMTFNPAGGWLYLGMAIRMAQDLGLHRNIESDNLDPIEKQNRKLAWWGCVVFDRLHSAMGGKPLAINEDDFDTTLPMDLGLKDTSLSLRFLTQSVRLTMLISKIMRAIYVPRGAGRNKTGANLWSLNKSLSDWEASVGSEFRVDYDKPQITTPHSSLINCFYQYSVILLNRPFIPRSKAHTLTSPKTPAQLICQRAASRITWISYHTPLEWQLHGTSVKPGLMLTSSAIHLINAMSSDEELARVAKNNFAVNLEIVRKISRVFFGAVQILSILEDLAKERGLLNLETTEEPILYDPPSAAISPNISHKLPRRTDSGSVVVLPNHLPLDNIQAFYDQVLPKETSGSVLPLPHSSNDWTSVQVDPLQSNNQFNIADPIYQSQNASSTVSFSLFDNNMSPYTNQVPIISSVPQYSEMSTDFMYSTMIPDDHQGIPAERSDNGAPLLDLLQMEIDFNDWNNYLNQFQNPGSKST